MIDDDLALSSGLIRNGEKVVLIDADPRIRRYYDAANGECPDAAITDLAKLRAGLSQVAR